MFFWLRPEIVHETIHISARFSKEDTHQYLRIFIIIIKISLEQLREQNLLDLE